jgi:hypothetical protein
MKMLLICILLLSHSFIFFRFYSFINVYMVLFLFNNVIYVFLLLCLCILMVCLCMNTLIEAFLAFSSAVRKMPRYNSQRRSTARTLPNFCVVLCIVCFVSFSVLFVYICVLYYCHLVATQLQLIKYHINHYV